MGSQPGMEKCYCACEQLSIWLLCMRWARANPLAQLPGLNSALASGVEDRVHLGRQNPALRFELRNLVLDRFHRVALVHLQSIGVGRLAFDEVLQIGNLFVHAGQLCLKSCELLAKAGDHLRTGWFARTAFPGCAVLCIPDLRNRVRAHIGEILIGPHFFSFLGLRGHAHIIRCC